MPNTIFENWVDKWRRTIESVRLNALPDDCRLEIKSSPTLQEVKAVEKEIGFSLPESFKEVLCDFSSGVDFFWFLREFVFSPEFDFINSGDCDWDLQNLVQLEYNRKHWLSLFRPLDAYDVSVEIFHDKLVFMSVGNGDSIAID